MEKQQENPPPKAKKQNTHTKTQPSMEVVRQIRATWTERRGRRRELEVVAQRRGEAKAQDGWGPWGSGNRVSSLRGPGQKDCGLEIE